MTGMRPPPKQPHDSARSHVKGESVFLDDRPFMLGELHCGLVISAVAKGTIKELDLTAVSSAPGVVCVITAKDFHQNCWGTIFQDQPFLADGKVQFHGEPVALVAAEDKWSLASALRLAKLTIAAEEPILSLPKAIAQESFIGPQRHIKRGDVDAWMKLADHIMKGRQEIAGQDHFYLESQCAISYPGEDGRIEVHASSQHPTEVQHLVAEALGLKHHQVICQVKRMGGAFGGKESQAAPFAVYAAMVTHKTGRPARIVLSKDDDMVITGKRNPFLIDYEVGFKDDGSLLALKARLFSDGGAYADLSTAIMERAMLHIDNAYYIPHMEVSGQVCRTNFHPSTAFRGFGGPKGVAAIEGIIEDIAAKLKRDAFDIRKMNCYREGFDTTHYGQQVADNQLPLLFEQLGQKVDYVARRKQIDAFNKNSQVELKGLALTAVKFGIAFTTRFLNQGSALVNLHMDGSVQVATGATEMGQGVNVKIATVVAEVFGISPDQVSVLATSTSTIHNTSPTAASSGSDINGQAAKSAAEEIKKRLQSIARQVLSRDKKLRGRAVAAAGTTGELTVKPHPDDQYFQFVDGKVVDETDPSRNLTFVEVIEEAYLNRVSLGERGFYRYPGIHFNKETGEGSPFLYFTTGVAASEVVIDRFTGELKVLRSDLLLDLGRSLNQGIDQGQVMGAFIQGVGWMTTEHLYYDDKGRLHSHSPSTYKIPGVHDVPRQFNVEFLEGVYCKPNLRGSKAVGEPPLLLGVSVWAAVKNALQYVNAVGARNLKVPATAEHILTIIEGE